MTYRRKKQHHIDVVAVLLLFTVFAFCLLSVLLTGAKVYSRLTAEDLQAYETRTAAQYLATRIRQADAADAVFAGSFDGGEGTDTLFLTQDYGNGSLYVTRLYIHEGYLCELFSEASGDLSPGDGEKILPAKALSFSYSENGLLTADITDARDVQTNLIWYLRSGKGGTP